MATKGYIAALDLDARNRLTAAMDQIAATLDLDPVALPAKYKTTGRKGDLNRAKQLSGLADWAEALVRLIGGQGVSHSGPRAADLQVRLDVIKKVLVVLLQTQTKAELLMLAQDFLLDLDDRALKDDMIAAVIDQLTNGDS